MTAVEQTLGGRFALRVADDRCSPEGGASSARTLAEEPAVLGVVGHYCTVAAMAALDVYETAGLPILIWGAHRPDVMARPRPGLFRLCASFAEENDALAKIAISRDWTRVARIGDRTDYARVHAGLFADSFARAGGTIVARDENPDAIHLAAAPLGWWKAFKGAKPAGAPDTAALLAELRASFWRGPVLSAAAIRIDDAPPPDGTICVSEAHAPAAGGFTRYAAYAADGVALLADLIAEGADTRAKLAAAIATQRRAGHTGSLAFATDGRREHMELPAFEAQNAVWKDLS
ncbi:MAG: ABC transporter substrate-binding protein [Tagaea sp.]|nr:ABC transporter substrate-binding protein [Tagaea sp.]